MHTKKLVFYVILLLISFIANGQSNKVDTIRLFFLGGQSNMAGSGKNIELPDSLNSPIDSVWIFQGNPTKNKQEEGGLGKWSLLQPGHGTNFKSDGEKNNLSAYFGAELSFGKTLKSLYPNEKIAIIKYAKGSTSIDSKALIGLFYGSWDPNYKKGKGINQYDYFLKTVATAINQKDIDQDGKEDYIKPCGIIWMQGESDALQRKTALRYKKNLEELMSLIRQTFGHENLPIVIGKISDLRKEKKLKVWLFGKIVQNAQELFVKEDRNAIIVRNTENYSYSDTFHYDSEGYILLGKEFAKAVHLLMQH